MKQLLKTGLFLLSFFILLKGYSQSSDREENKKKITTPVDEGRYVFKAQTALPMRGNTIPLTSDYTLTVGRDTVTAYLPYFGRAYVAPLDPTQGGVQFTSTAFEYKSKKGKKGWNIQITIKDNPDTRNLSLTVSQEGYASLQVISNNRQPISFTGYVTGGK